MKIFKKMMAIALTVTVVLGCGATLNAASTSYRIDDTFPDKTLNKFVRRYDLNNDGYLDQSEISRAGSETFGMQTLEITDPDIESLEGIEIFTSCEQLWLENYKPAVLNVSTFPFPVVMVWYCDMTTFVCGKNQQTVSIGDCPNVKNTYFNLATNLGSLAMSGCPLLKTLHLENSPYMTHFVASYCGVREIDFSDAARMQFINIEDCPVRHIDMLGSGLTGLYYFYLHTNGKAYTGIACKADLARFIWSHPLPNNNGYKCENYAITLDIDFRAE